MMRLPLCPRPARPARGLLRRLSGKAGFRRLGAAEEGAQLVEFAMALPFLLILVIGIIDFGGAFNLKQKMANAAREGARMAIANTLSNTSCSSSTPCSIQAAENAVANYMTNDGVNSSCLNSSSASSAGAQAWTFSCASGITLTIDRGYTFTPSGGTPIQATKVTLTYPYTWTFNHIIGLLVPGARSSLPSAITTTTVMQNLVAN